MSECNHIWTRTNGAITDDGCDTFRCDKCHITGKSFGLSGIILPNSNNQVQKKSNGVTFRRGRGKSLETILKESKKRGDGLEWSRQQYEERMKNETDDNGQV